MLPNDMCVRDEKCEPADCRERTPTWHVFLSIATLCVCVSVQRGNFSTLCVCVCVQTEKVTIQAQGYIVMFAYVCMFVFRYDQGIEWIQFCFP
jgi:hypothetical protein